MIRIVFDTKKTEKFILKQCTGIVQDEDITTGKLKNEIIWQHLTHRNLGRLARVKVTFLSSNH
jgi:hypothetical protein